VRRGVPFRQAHDIVGQVLRVAEKQGKPWTQVELSDLKAVSPQIGDDFLRSFSVESAIAAKAVPGGTGEESVRAAIAQLEAKLETLEKMP
jgi:argininosuccinate lyase